LADRTLELLFRSSPDAPGAHPTTHEKDRPQMSDSRDRYRNRGRYRSRFRLRQRSRCRPRWLVGVESIFGAALGFVPSSFGIGSLCQHRARLAPAGAGVTARPQRSGDPGGGLRAASFAALYLTARWTSRLEPADTLRNEWCRDHGIPCVPSLPCPGVATRCGARSSGR
jgi:hypothetical protein